MSAGGVLQAAVRGALAADAAFAGLTVFDAPPVRGGLPYAVVGEPVLADAGAVGLSGRDGRIVVALFDGGERPVRLRGLLGVAEDLLPGMARDLGEGWRLAQLRLVRSRLARDGPDRWTATAEFQVRLYRAHA